jgi:DNA-binding PadR family transcriptional regulator
MGVIPVRDNIKGGALTETTLLVLLAAYSPRHGYGILQFIEQETQGRVTLGAGTLYGAIGTLQKKGWLEPLEKDGREGKKAYLVTALGRRVVEDEQRRLAEISALTDKILRGQRV